MKTFGFILFVLLLQNSGFTAQKTIQELKGVISSSTTTTGGRATAFTDLGRRFVNGSESRALDKTVDFLFPYIEFSYPQHRYYGRIPLGANQAAYAIVLIGEAAIPSVLRNTDRDLSDKEKLIIAFIVLSIKDPKNGDERRMERRTQIQQALLKARREKKILMEENLREILVKFNKISSTNRSTWPTVSKEDAINSSQGFVTRFGNSKREPK